VHRYLLLAIVSVSLALGIGASTAHAEVSIPWATQSSASTGSTVAPASVSTLADGSTIVTGQFSGTVDFGFFRLTSSGSADIYVAKVDASGEYVWAVRAGGSNSSSWDTGRGVSVLADGSAIVTGSFRGTADFGEFTLVGDSLERDDMFVAKISASGAFVWATKGGGDASGYCRGRDVSTLPDGSAIVTGSFTGTANFGSTTPIANSGSGGDIFVARIDANGTFVWATRAGGSGNDSSYGVSVLSNGSAILTGYITPTATFATATGSISLSGVNAETVFIAKVDATGSFVWATQAALGSSGDDAQGTRVSALADGSAILTGYVNGAADFGTTAITSNASSNDIFVAKIDASGAWVWATSTGGTSSDVGNSVSAFSDGSAIVTGYFRGTVAFGTSSVTSNTSSDDTFVAKIGGSGAWVWATSAGGTTSTDKGTGVSAMPDGSAIVVGSFDGVAVFGSITLTSTGTSSAFDGFVAKFLDAAQAPAAPHAVAGDGQATVTITPLAGGSVTTYTVLSGPGGKTCTITAPATSCIVTGLTNGTSYTFTVTATNTTGTSPASAPSNAITPTSTTAATTTTTTATSTKIDVVVLPGRTRLRSGETMRIAIRASNSSKATVASVTTCLTLPANLVVTHTGGAQRAGRSLCFSLGSLAAGATRTRAVHVRAVTQRTVTRRVIGTARSSTTSASLTTARSTPIRISALVTPAETVTG
jgi:hypothetical protein